MSSAVLDAGACRLWPGICSHVSELGEAEGLGLEQLPAESLGEEPCGWAGADILHSTLCAHLLFLLKHLFKE